MVPGALNQDRGDARCRILTTFQVPPQLSNDQVFARSFMCLHWFALCVVGMGCPFVGAKIKVNLLLSREAAVARRQPWELLLTAV